MLGLVKIDLGSRALESVVDSTGVITRRRMAGRPRASPPACAPAARVRNVRSCTFSPTPARHADRGTRPHDSRPAGGRRRARGLVAGRDRRARRAAAPRRRPRINAAARLRLARARKPIAEGDDARSQGPKTRVISARS